jgi:hypothetical protein
VVEVGKLSLAATKINLKQEQRLIALGFWKTFQGQCFTVYHILALHPSSGIITWNDIEGSAPIQRM